MPAFFSVTVKPIWSPAVMLAASATLSTSIAAHSTSTVAVSLSEPSLVVVTEAVLSTRPQSSLSVVATTWTVVVAPAASVDGARTSLPSAIDQPADAGEIDQAKPAGRTSVNCTPFASPAPAFFSVTVNPICSPAETLPASAVLSTSIVAQSTSTVAVSESDPSLEVVTEAVLDTSPQSALSVVATTWTEVEAPAARVVGA